MAKLDNLKGVIDELKSHIPKEWAPLSPYSYYNFNEYFKEKIKQYL